MDGHMQVRWMVGWLMNGVDGWMKGYQDEWMDGKQDGLEGLLDG